MEKVTVITGKVAPLDRANVDTDAIMPKQFLKSIERTGFGQYIFDEWRYLDHGEPGMDCSKRPQNPDFCLNQPRYQGASILLTRDNFGCGSSREHAPWGLKEYGFKVIIAPSFAEIFYYNCLKNGMLPVALKEAEVDELFKQTFAQEDFSLTVDLLQQQVAIAKGKTYKFEIDAAYKERLSQGLDDIALTLQQADVIKSYEQKRQQQEPWVFSDIKV